MPESSANATEPRPSGIGIPKLPPTLRDPLKLLETAVFAFREDELRQSLAFARLAAIRIEAAIEARTINAVPNPGKWDRKAVAVIRKARLHA